MKNDARSPRIAHLSWGRLEVEGRAAPYKDAKLFPGGSREWDWRESGTAHAPGIQRADVQELLEHGARAVVLATGFHERLRVMPETVRWLEEQGIELHILPSGDAAERYNSLRTERPVGALVHSTC